MLLHTNHKHTEQLMSSAHLAHAHCSGVHCLVLSRSSSEFEVECLAFDVNALSSSVKAVRKPLSLEEKTEIMMDWIDGL